MAPEMSLIDVALSAPLVLWPCPRVLTIVRMSARGLIRTAWCLVLWLANSLIGALGSNSTPMVCFLPPRSRPPVSTNTLAV